MKIKVWTKEGRQELTFDEWNNNFDYTLLHRTDGPAEEFSEGTKRWSVNGKIHRIDGPAVELSNGSKFWYKDGKRHRTDGPAKEWWNGSTQWYIDNKEINKEEVETWLAENDIDLKTEKGQASFAFRWS